MRRLLSAIVVIAIVCSLSSCAYLKALDPAFAEIEDAMNAELGYVEPHSSGSAYGSSSSLSRIADQAEREFAEHGNVHGAGSVYWGYWGCSAQNWCCDFVYCCADKIGLVGADKPFGRFTGWCPTAWTQLVDAGASVVTDVESVQRGDIMFWFNRASFQQETGGRGDKTKYLSHIGIVTGNDGQGLHTIQGNVNSGGRGCTNSMVAEITYPRTDWARDMSGVAGFLRVSPPITTELVDLVIGFEGFTKYPQWDYAQWSVGYGTRCPDDKLEDYKRNGISEASARTLLNQHLSRSVSDVERWTQAQGLTLEQYQIDALTSLTYNLGNGWLQNEKYSDLRQYIIDDGGDQQIMEAFVQICHAGGKVLPTLIQRRICEAHLYLTGEYTNDYLDTGWSYGIAHEKVIVTRG